MISKKQIFSFLVIILVMLWGCVSVTEKEKEQEQPQELTDVTEKDVSKDENKIFFNSYPNFSKKVKSLYLSLSLEQRIAQLLIVPLPATYVLNENLVNYFSELEPGGVILFGRNIQDIEQVKKLTAQIKDTLAINPFISVDVEGGLVNRFRNISNPVLGLLPSAQRLAVEESPNTLRTKIASVGEALLGLGITMNLAPVADVKHSNTPNFLSSRVFSDDPNIVADYVTAFASGLMDAGVIPVVKHFPGHGAASADTHEKQARVDLTQKQLQEKDLIPFQKSIERGVPAIMMGHLFVPALDSDALVVELSSPIIDMVRFNMNFDGVIMTDSLSMKAVATDNVGELFEERALNAGVNILLDSSNAVKLHKRLVQSYRDGKLIHNAIELSTLRVLHLKEQFGLLE